MSPAPSGRARSFALAFAAFLPMAAIGTLVHEAGHLLAALALGHEAVLHFGSVSHWDEGGAAWEDGAVTLAGPLSNVAAGTAGAMTLWRRRRGRRDQPMDLGDGLAFALALFWSRQLAVALAMALGISLNRDSLESDESKLSGLASLPNPTIAFATGAVGLAVCLVAASLLPPRTRVPLLGGAALGSVAGFPLWHAWLGPLVLP